MTEYSIKISLRRSGTRRHQPSRAPRCWVACALISDCCICELQSPVMSAAGVKTVGYSATSKSPFPCCGQDVGCGLAGDVQRQTQVAQRDIGALSDPGSQARPTAIGSRPLMISREPSESPPKRTSVSPMCRLGKIATRCGLPSSG